MSTDDINPDVLASFLAMPESPWRMALEREAQEIMRMVGGGPAREAGVDVFAFDDYRPTDDELAERIERARERFGLARTYDYASARIAVDGRPLADSPGGWFRPLSPVTDEPRSPTLQMQGFEGERPMPTVTRELARIAQARLAEAGPSTRAWPLSGYATPLDSDVTPLDSDLGPGSPAIQAQVRAFEEDRRERERFVDAQIRAGTAVSINGFDELGRPLPRDRWQIGETRAFDSPEAYRGWLEQDAWRKRLCASIDAARAHAAEDRAAIVRWLRATAWERIPFEVPGGLCRSLLAPHAYRTRRIACEGLRARCLTSACWLRETCAPQPHQRI